MMLYINIINKKYMKTNEVKTLKDVIKYYNIPVEKLMQFEKEEGILTAREELKVTFKKYNPEKHLQDIVRICNMFDCFSPSRFSIVTKTFCEFNAKENIIEIMIKVFEEVKKNGKISASTFFEIAEIAYIENNQ